jgi:hypothetical protein
MLWISALQAASAAAPTGLLALTTEFSYTYLTFATGGRQQQRALAAAALAVPSRGVSQAPPTGVSIHPPTALDSSHRRVASAAAAARRQQMETCGHDSGGNAGQMEDGSLSEGKGGRSMQQQRLHTREDSRSPTRPHTLSSHQNTNSTPVQSATVIPVPAPPPRSRSIGPASRPPLQHPTQDAAAGAARSAARSLSHAPPSQRPSAMSSALTAVTPLSVKPADSDSQVCEMKGLCSEIL